MGFFDRVFGGGGIPTHEGVTQLQVTPGGIEKMNKSLLSGLEFDVFVTIKKLQPCSVDEIARDLNRPENKIRYAAICLKNKGCISKI